MLNLQADVAVVGAGAAGLFFAGQLSDAGIKCIVFEHNNAPGRKILVSGGGRCNFTNKRVTSEDFVSQNPHFCKSALSRFRPADFVELVKNNEIDFYEKKLGQLFCKKSAKLIVEMLLSRVHSSDCKIVYNCGHLSVQKNESEFLLTNDKKLSCKTPRLVVATGGLSFPKIGATNWGLSLAKQFGHRIIPTEPALVGYVIPKFKELAGVSLIAKITINGFSICEDLLFTHKGLSGPAALKSSLYWHPSKKLKIDFLPESETKSFIESARKNAPQRLLGNVLANLLPQRFVDFLLGELGVDGKKQIAHLTKLEMDRVIQWIHSFEIVPESLEGYHKAEVTRGGVSTEEVSSKTLESKLTMGLYFIGEVLDVTGQLGGYNFQWAWASAFAAAEEVKRKILDEQDISN